MPKRKKNPLDAQIEQFYYKNAQGKQINIMDIGNVFAAGHKASKEGKDVETAIKEAIDKYCVNA